MPLPKPKTNLDRVLRQLGACGPAIEFYAGLTLEEAWAKKGPHTRAWKKWFLQTGINTLVWRTMLTCACTACTPTRKMAERQLKRIFGVIPPLWESAVIPRNPPAYLLNIDRKEVKK